MISTLTPSSLEVPGAMLTTDVNIISGISGYKSLSPDSWITGMSRGWSTEILNPTEPISFRT